MFEESADAAGWVGGGRRDGMRIERDLFSPFLAKVVNRHKGWRFRMVKNANNRNVGSNVSCCRNSFNCN